MLQGVNLPGYQLDEVRIAEVGERAEDLVGLDATVAIRILTPSGNRVAIGVSQPER